MPESIPHIEAVKIIKEYPTKGSGPLQVIGEDDNLYVAKFTDLQHPYFELINEVVCGGLAKAWRLKVPELAIISFTPEVVADFKFSDRYKSRHFEGEFFGSRLIEPELDLSPYMGGVSRKQYNEFENGLDLLKIGCFDHWIGNKDRSPANPNILLTIDQESQQFCFNPIDHTAAFDYLDYKVLKPNTHIHLDKCIMQVGFIRSIQAYEDKKALVNLQKSIEICISNSLEVIDSIFEQVPKEWGFSKKARVKLKDFLSNQQRNQGIAQTYLRYLK